MRGVTGRWTHAAALATKNKKSDWDQHEVARIQLSSVGQYAMTHDFDGGHNAHDATVKK